MKNTNLFEDNKVIKLAEFGEIREGKAYVKKLFDSENATTALAIFDKDSTIPSHSSPGIALVQVLAGDVLIVIDEKDYIVKEGESIAIAKNAPHSLTGITQAKAYITKLFE